MDNIEQIIDRVFKSPTPSLPADFTDNVMQRIADSRQSSISGEDLWAVACLAICTLALGFYLEPYLQPIRSGGLVSGGSLDELIGLVKTALNYLTEILFLLQASLAGLVILFLDRWCRMRMH